MYLRDCLEKLLQILVYNFIGKYFVISRYCPLETLDPMVAGMGCYMFYGVQHPSIIIKCNIDI